MKKRKNPSHGRVVMLVVGRLGRIYPMYTHISKCWSSIGFEVISPHHHHIITISSPYRYHIMIIIIIIIIIFRIVVIVIAIPQPLHQDRRV